jgi:hypothetical protein
MGIVIPLGKTSVYEDFHADVIFLTAPVNVDTDETIIPEETWVYTDYHASVNFIVPVSANFDFDAIVSFYDSTPIPPIPPIENSSSPIGAFPGTVSNVIVGASAIILTQTINFYGAFLSGIQAAGETNGNYYFSINGTTIFEFFTNITKPDIEYNLPGILAINYGDVISLYVINTGNVTSNYNGTLLGGI